jgi:Flp pilus assembly pilin Flp
MKLKGLKLNRKGQTALEYALVVAAVSLVIMVAWNQVGDQVQKAISGNMLGMIKDNLTKGNGSIKR